MRSTFTIISLAISFLACTTAHNGQTPAGNQGVQGYITELRGNQMPGPGRRSAPSKGNPVQTTVYVFERALSNQGSGSAPLYDTVYTKLVASGLTNKEGFYKIPVPKGHYTVLVKADGKYYANLFDASYINPVQVRKKHWTDLNITLTHHAAF